MSETEPKEMQLCTSCAAPNLPSANFCVKCGAPLTSYAGIAPFERLFAEGFVYRQAAEQPRRLIVVIGIWIIFGSIALGSLIIISLGFGLQMILGVASLLVSIVMLWKTTKNYFFRTKNTKSDNPLETSEK
ncbi:MAG TPA: zinc ribbon domain-containing protein [Verrucomicrobiae bacterium]|nr:zinc ribbon domain-containing protein [Verrucomicrobiae bacterium]